MESGLESPNSIRMVDYCRGAKLPHLQLQIGTMGDDKQCIECHRIWRNTRGESGATGAMDRTNILAKSPDLVKALFRGISAHGESGHREGIQSSAFTSEEYKNANPHR